MRIGILISLVGLSLMLFSDIPWDLVGLVLLIGGLIFERMD